MTDIITQRKLAIGQAIKEAREAKGWTHNKMALELYKSFGTSHRITQIKGLEEGSMAYTIDLLIKAQEVLEIDIFNL